MKISSSCNTSLKRSVVNSLNHASPEHTQEQNPSSTIRCVCLTKNMWTHYLEKLYCCCLHILKYSYYIASCHCFISGHMLFAVTKTLTISYKWIHAKTKSPSKCISSYLRTPFRALNHIRINNFGQNRKLSECYWSGFFFLLVKILLRITPSSFLNSVWFYIRTLLHFVFLKCMKTH